MLSRPALTIGVEEEYQIVDPESRELQSIISHFHAQSQLEVYGREIMSELHQSMVEVGTGICHTADDILKELQSQRRYIRDLASEKNWRMVAASTHPISRWDVQEISPYERYRQIANEYQIIARRMLIWGMHVHIGISHKDFLIDVMNITRYFLPHMLALTGSSPFWSGLDTGMKSYRVHIGEGFPRSGTPDILNSWAAYEALIRTLIQTNCIPDASKIWWNVRPHHAFPTLEFRISDICPRIKESVAIAALFQALVLWVWKLRSQNVSFRLYKSDLINENKWRASLQGLDCKFVDLGNKEEISARTAIRDLLAMLDEEIGELESKRHIEEIYRILEVGTSADRQLAVYRDTGDLKQVVDHLVEETISDLD